MIRTDFEKFRAKLMEEEDYITKTKGKDYTKSSEDCLANFKEGEQLGLTPLQTAGMFAKKHIDAIYNYIKTNGKSESEPIRERIKDARNYLVFILALIEEENLKTESKIPLSELLLATQLDMIKNGPIPSEPDMPFKTINVDDLAPEARENHKKIMNELKTNSNGSKS